jgi:preprotein translocase subunit SecA
MVELLRRLGMNDDEVIGHSMINKSIRNAQKKIQEKITTEQKAASQRAWIALNVKQ